LKKSSDKISEGVSEIFKKRKLNYETLQELDELLISADIGVATSAKLIEVLSKTKFNQDVSDEEVLTVLAQAIGKILTPIAIPLAIQPHSPHVILVVGVNGSGKTTTIGKLAKQWKDQGKSIRIVAGDTFRAAAVEQLQIWGDRVGAIVMAGKHGADSASLSYDSFLEAKKEKDDVLIIDTAGRLQNKVHLMAELKKIRRVLQRLDPKIPHSCLLILDATTGQNSHSQVEVFKDIAGVTGLVLTKLDGTAKGGVLVRLADRFKLPVHAVGVGETAEDLHSFNANNFANGLMGLGKSELKN
jgi:fused signal recognition particle receptor